MVVSKLKQVERVVKCGFNNLQDIINDFEITPKQKKDEKNKIQRRKNYRRNTSTQSASDEEEENEPRRNVIYGDVINRFN